MVLVLVFLLLLLLLPLPLAFVLVGGLRLITAAPALVVASKPKPKPKPEPKPKQADNAQRSHGVATRLLREALLERSVPALSRALDDARAAKMSGALVDQALGGQGRGKGRGRCGVRVRVKVRVVLLGLQSPRPPLATAPPSAAYHPRRR